MRAPAAVSAAMKLGGSAVQDRLVSVLDLPGRVHHRHAGIARAMVAIVSPRLVVPALAARARAGLDRCAQPADERSSAS